MQAFVRLLEAIDDFLYYPVLLVVLTLAGIYFSFRTKFAQIRLCKEAIRVIMEHPKDKENVSPFQALMISTASRVGTGNIIGVSTAICLGGPGSVFWMWVLAILGGASALVESTLAQIYKCSNPELNQSYGGPAYYIEHALHSKFIALIFSIFLIATYAFGFNALCSYNLQSTFSVYSFYDRGTTPLIIGIILSIIIAWCLFGGGKRIINVASVLVPFMGIIYVAVALFIMLKNISVLPLVFKLILQDAFNFKAILSGVSGSCLIYGIKRGLYSNEAGVGSAPNAAAAAYTSHPVKQGLVQMLSVYIDTILICSATAFICIVYGPGSSLIAGAEYVQLAIRSGLGKYGPLFITLAMICFAFTTLIGNLFYIPNALAFINNKKMPGKKFMNVFWVICSLVVLVGAILPMSAAWALADITMGGMTLINIPSIMLLGGVFFKALKDYEQQKREGKDPVFLAKNIGLDPDKLDYWK